jgi:hypothetical protein
MKPNKKLKSAKDFGMTIKPSSSLDRTSQRVEFPEKLDFANKVIATLKWES